jgi:16S rRNA (uracil1498-N3)-methyltransferase
MDRFYFHLFDRSDAEIIIEGNEAHHIIIVARKGVGDKIEVSNGKGEIRECEIVSIKKKQVVCRVLNRIHLEKGKPQFNFLVPVLKSPNRFEFMLEKLTELGVNEIIPFVSENSLKVSDKNVRWKKVLISAMKQSQVDLLPQLRTLSDFNQVVNQIDLTNSLIYYGDVEGINPSQLMSSQQIPKVDSIYLVVGPEGDFSKKERELLLSLSSTPVKLSMNRLRSETAAIVLMSLIKNLQKEAVE